MMMNNPRDRLNFHPRCDWETEEPRLNLVVFLLVAVCVSLAVWTALLSAVWGIIVAPLISLLP